MSEPMPPIPPPPEDPSERPTSELPPFIRLDAFLDQPDPEVVYRLDQLWPADARIVLAAQFKAGKSTAVGNLLRSLVDHHPFLGTFEVAPPSGRVVLLDDELHPNTLRRWLRGQGIGNAEQVDVLPLRGQLSTFNVLEDATRQAWAGHLADTGASILIVDCLRPLIDALGLSEDKDVGRVLEALDELTATAGISELAIVHHMGHSGERSRGDSRLRDWPDAEWRIVRHGDQPDADRYFSAYGRDVDVPEQRLVIDGRRLHLVEGSRQDANNEQAVRDLVRAITDRPGMSSRELRDEVPLRASQVDAAKAHAVKAGLIEVRPDGRARRHYPANVSDVSHRVPDTGHHDAGNVSRVSIGTRTRHGHDPAQESPERVPGHRACSTCGRTSYADPCRDCTEAA